MLFYACSWTSFSHNVRAPHFVCFGLLVAEVKSDFGSMIKQKNDSFVNIIPFNSTFLISKIKRDKDKQNP